jgi:hypothetical protein
MATLQFIPNAVSKGTTGLQLSLDDIPQEVKENAEEVYKTLKTNPGRIRVKFGSLVEMNQYVSQITTYCALRPEGAIRFRKSPSRGLEPTEMDFRITDIPVTEAQTEEIRDAVVAVKNTAKK